MVRGVSIGKERRRDAIFVAKNIRFIDGPEVLLIDSFDSCNKYSSTNGPRSSVPRSSGGLCFLFFGGWSAPEFDVYTHWVCLKPQFLPDMSAVNNLGNSIRTAPHLQHPQASAESHQQLNMF